MSWCSFMSAGVRPAVIAILAPMLAPLAAAQQAPYPSKAIRLIASQAPGGGIDYVCRIVAPKLSDSVGQTVIVDNRPGANGSLAAEITAKSPADGYTLMLGAVGNLGTNVLFYKKLGYDPLRDLAPITSAVSSVSVLVVHPYESHAWYGFVVPAKTPQPVVSRLHQELSRILHAPDVTQALLAQGLEVWTMTPDAFGAYIKSEVEKWTRVIREAGINET